MSSVERGPLVTSGVFRDGHQKDSEVTCRKPSPIHEANVLAKVPKTAERVGWTEKIWRRMSFQADREHNAWRMYLIAKPRWTTESLPSEVLDMKS